MCECHPWFLIILPFYGCITSTDLHIEWNSVLLNIFTFTFFLFVLLITEIHFFKLAYIFLKKKKKNLVWKKQTQNVRVNKKKRKLPVIWLFYLTFWHCGIWFLIFNILTWVALFVYHFFPTCHKRTSFRTITYSTSFQMVAQRPLYRYSTVSLTRLLLLSVQVVFNFSSSKKF